MNAPVFAQLIRDFIFAFIATLGFCFLYRTPKRLVLIGALLGAVTYLFFDFFSHLLNHTFFSCFISCILMAILAKVFAGRFRTPAMIFILPGMIALVPGAGIYHSIVSLIQEDYSGFVKYASDTMFIAFAISSAIALVNMFFKVFSRKKSSKSESAFVQNE